MSTLLIWKSATCIQIHSISAETIPVARDASSSIDSLRRYNLFSPIFELHLGRVFGLLRSRDVNAAFGRSTGFIFTQPNNINDPDPLSLAEQGVFLGNHRANPHAYTNTANVMNSRHAPWDPGWVDHGPRVTDRNTQRALAGSHIITSTFWTRLLLHFLTIVNHISLATFIGTEDALRAKTD